jgi:chitodextrinase
MSYDTFAGLPANQGVQGTTWDSGDVTWLTPTFIVGDGTGNGQPDYATMGYDAVFANFLPVDGTVKVGVFFKSASGIPNIPGVMIHGDGSAPDAYNKNGILVRHGGGVNFEVVNLSGSETNSASFGSVLLAGQEYYTEIEFVAPQTYKGRLYQSSGGVPGTLLAQNSITLATARPATAKIAQLWDFTGHNFSMSRVNALPAAVADTTAPTMTGTVTSSGVTSTGFTIDWSGTTRSDNVAITGYETSPDGGSTWVDRGTATLAAYTGLSPSTSYTRLVRAYDAAGNKSTPALSVTVVTSAPAGDTTVPVLAGSITQGTITATSSQISWPAGTDNVAVTSYEVSKDGGSTWTDVGNVLTYTFTGLTASTGYTQKVRAKDAAGNVSTPALSLAVTTSAPAAAGTFKTRNLANNAQSAWAAGTAVYWEWWQGGRIGSVPTSVVRGNGVLASDGTLTMTGLPSGAGIALLAARGATYDLDGVYYQPGTAA